MGTGGTGSGVWSTPAATSGLAVAGFVVGILWLGGLGSIVAIAFGAVALSRIRDSEVPPASGLPRSPSRGGRGLATAAIVIGSVGLTVAAALYTGIALGPMTSRSASLRLNVAATEARLKHNVLGLSDLPADWEALPVSVGNPSDAGAIARAFGSCGDQRSALLDDDGPDRRVASPFLIGPTAETVVEFVMAAEPSVPAAKQAMLSLDRSGEMACVERLLTQEWDHWAAQYPTTTSASSRDEPVVLARLHVTSVGDQSEAFRITLSSREEASSLASYEDVVMIRHGQVDALLTFADRSSPASPGLESEVDAKMASHLRSSIVVYARARAS